MQNHSVRHTAVVTGASYGVGAATAVALARSGYDLALTATEVDHLAATVTAVRAAGARVFTTTLDLCSSESVDQAVANITEAFGLPTLLVNNAATTLLKPAIEINRLEWEHLISANITGTFFLTQAFARQWISAGQSAAIVNMASTHGIIAAVDQSAYGISKAALIHMTRMLAVEWASHHIRINAVAPGRVETASPARLARARDPDRVRAALARIPLQRFATADEVAHAVCYLASVEAASVTGHIFVIDGGLTVA